MQRITDEVLDRIEREHPHGISSAEILDTLAAHDIKFSEATLRKYVQLGLLPRSVRVGKKGHRPLICWWTGRLNRRVFNRSIESCP